MNTPQLPTVDYAMLYGQLSEAVNFAGLQITRNSRGIMTLEPIKQQVGEVQVPFGHVYRVVVDAEHPSAKREWVGPGVVFELGAARSEGVSHIGAGARGCIQRMNLYAAPPAQGIDPLPIYALTKAWMAKADNLATAPHVARALYACAKEVRDVLPLELLA